MTSSEPAKRDYPKKGRKPEKRAWALKQARQVIVTSQGIASTREISAVDLVSLAEYILTGEDPWAQPAPEPVKSTTITTTEVTVEVTRASA